MSEIKRYRPVKVNVGGGATLAQMTPDENGVFVAMSDHLATIKQERIDAVREAFSVIFSEIPVSQAINSDLLVSVSEIQRRCVEYLKEQGE